MTASPLIEEVSKLVSDITGVQLGRKQAAMVESRLSRRMLQLGFTEPKAYLKYIYDNQNSEVTALVSLLTTHHTTFFREFSHFEFLERTGLPDLIRSLRARKQDTLRIWSAACSRGHEVYSLAMFLDYHLKKMAPEIKFEILGTDVDPKSIDIAMNGVYRWDDIKSAPAMYLANHWVRGTGEIADFVKIKSHLRSPVNFKTVNLLDLNATMSGKSFDVIFCRNVFIYFTMEQVRAVTSNLLKHLNPDGLLFIGISETLNGTSLPISYLAPSVYSHKRAAIPAPAPVHTRVQPSVSSPNLVPKTAPASKPLIDFSKPLRVFCIDDSATILSLLKKLLSAEHGFEVVGTAENGLDATEKLKVLNSDVITLDIHMPIQGGIEYLRKNMGPNHPPVVMVSSVSREDVELGLKSLELGAVDYVEKPSLADLAKRADEIRMKLRCAALAGKGVQRGVLEIEKSFQKSHYISEPDKKLRVIVGGIGDREKIVSMVARMKGAQPPAIFLFQGVGNMLETLQAAIKAATNLTVNTLDCVDCDPKIGTVYVGDFAKFQDCKAKLHQKQVSVLIFGDVAGTSVDALMSGWSKSHLIVEDLQVIVSEQHKALIAAAKRVVPFTSFLYHSDEYLSEGETK
ncbi:MAG TPA: hypothetical protein DCS07_11015 [Bdellovibrionales bacterium]|nr:MAG: hypothetical protein A2Z97_09350 [Bdellovibrionales bacterium GWB1_52_6]OFZ04126.1 MAG: hypothetical protein A2X97_15105 [Bdellovibrionales bacterium GWA1_52_35]OFZ35438.1 MAG: hypothetical protein A2070_12255 [Bdellovibrionales bacterium GWC1_52_8]HAR43139.1 hypothetical protein [Bdellovibrionales bacterium]HCM40465.1 hypothetical protein [Bdellovibrionales bacterium]